MTIATSYFQVSNNNPDGAQFGAATTDKIAFYGVTPIVQRSGSTQATLTLVTVSTSDTGFGFRTSDGFNAAMNQLTEVRNTLVALGLWAGA